MQCKTGAEHTQSLKDGRTVYLDGKLVDDVTTHVAYRNAVASAAMLYDYQAPREYRADDVPAGRRNSARQPLLADAAQLR